MRFLARGSAPLSGVADRSDPLTRGLELWLPLTEDGGGIARDGLGRPINAKLSGAAWFVGAGPNGAALRHSGPGGPSKIIIANNVGFTSPIGPLTLSIWANILGIWWQDVSLIMQTHTNLPAPFGLAVRQSDHFPVLLMGNGAGYAVWQASSAVPFTQWVHVAVTLDGTSTSSIARFYLNGMNIGSGASFYQASFGGPAGNAGDPLEIGGQTDDGNQLDGYTSDARIYSRALTPGEIMMLYTDGLRPWMAKPRRAIPKPAAVAPGYRARVVRWG